MDIYDVLQNVITDIECMVERKQIPNILDDVVYVRAYQALNSRPTKRAPDARKSAPKSRSKNSKGSAKPARG